MRASIDSATPKPLQCLFCAYQRAARRIRVRLSRVATQVRGACIHTRCASLQTKIPCWDAGCCCCSFSGVVGCQRCGSIDGNTAPFERKAACCSETSVALGWASEGQRRKRLRAVCHSTFQSRCWTAQLRIRSHLCVNRSLLQSNRAASAAGGAATVCSQTGAVRKGSYLVDPASSHMLVSKIKPCMSKYKLLYTVKLRMAH